MTTRHIAAVTISTRLRTARIAAGLGVRELARMSGVSAPVISRAESGREPSLIFAIRLAKLLGYPVEELWEVKIHEPPKGDNMNKKKSKSKKPAGGPTDLEKQAVSNQPQHRDPGTAVNRDEQALERSTPASDEDPEIPETGENS